MQETYRLVYLDPSISYQLLDAASCVIVIVGGII